MGGEEKVEAAFEVEAMELAQYGNWVIMETGEEEEDGEDEVCETSSTSTIDSFLENSIFSNESSSLELAEDASSSSSSSASNPSLSSSPLSSGPLYELSELMASLPIKRGLSKFYHGKSQSFTSLASAQSLEDLAKRVTIPQRKKMKSCKSYGGGLDAQRSSYSPKAIIAKKALKGVSSSPVSKRNSGLFDSH